MTTQLARFLVECCRDRPVSSVQVGLRREHRQYLAAKLSVPAVHVPIMPTDNNGVGSEPETVQDNDCLSNAQGRPGLLNCASARPGRFGDRACRVAEILLELGELRLSRLRGVFAIYRRSA
jgi:hypothetical protein